mgnify:CR=1 FL=1
MAIARPIYSSMLSAHTDSDFFGIGNPKVSQLFGLVVLLILLVEIGDAAGLSRTSLKLPQ